MENDSQMAHSQMILKWQIQCTNGKNPIFYVDLSGLEIVYLNIFGLVIL